MKLDYYCEENSHRNFFEKTIDWQNTRNQIIKDMQESPLCPDQGN